MKGGGRKIFGYGQPPCNNNLRMGGDDQDLVMFREMHKREKERIVSLLQPVSEEFEPNGIGNYPLYRIPSAKKSSGYDFLAESNNKNDYDWLKTPPATPLFASLEMEANAPELTILQRELPILQPLSRFSSGNSETSKTVNGTPKTPTLTPKVPQSQRAVTPSGRPSISSSVSHDTKNSKATPILKTTQISSHHGKTSNFTASNNVVTPKAGANQKESHLSSYLTSNLSKNTNATATDSKTKPRSRGVSPLGRSTIPSKIIPGFSNETPPNLRTDDRSSSATRGRPINPTITIHQKGEPTPVKAIRRQSCSPSMSRGRKQDIEGNNNNNNNVANTQRVGRFQQTGNGTQFLGSRMVDKVMNARKLGADQERLEPKPIKPRGTTKIESSGFGRIMPKSSLDVALKHMRTRDINRDQTNPRHFGTPLGNST